MGALGNAGAFNRVPAAAFKQLRQHGWPGNVRELRNLVEVALAYDKGGRVDLARYLNETAASTRGRAKVDDDGDSARENGERVRWPSFDRPYGEWLEEANHAYFGALYEEADGNLTEMMRLSQVHRDTIRKYLRTLGIGNQARR